MKVLLFGATGMVGQGVLRECLEAPDVALVQTVGRTATGQRHAKLREIAHANLLDYRAIEDAIQGFDACFFCLGVSSSGMSEGDYTRVTHDFTLAAARTLILLNPGMTFIYVSGAGADSSEQGGSMWARVRGRTENALLQLPFKTVCVFRPTFIQPLHGARSKTTSYRIFYTILSPLLPLARLMLPRVVLSTEIIGRAMLAIARHGAPKPVLDASEIHALAK